MVIENKIFGLLRLQNSDILSPVTRLRQSEPAPNTQVAEYAAKRLAQLVLAELGQTGVAKFHAYLYQAEVKGRIMLGVIEYTRDEAGNWS